MKALSVRQPYADAIVRGRKTIEVRTRATSHRGLIAVHASMLPDRELAEHCAGLPVGCIIGTVCIVGCEPLTRDHLAAACLTEDSDTEGAWAWLLADAQPIEPVPARGKLGLWEWAG